MGGEVYLEKKTIPKILADDVKKKNGVVINAGGAKELIKSGYKDILTGFQMDIESIDKWIKDDVTEIYVDKGLNPEYFCWITPLADNYMRIGTASSGRVRDTLHRINENLGIPINRVVREFGGVVITGGPRKKFMDKNMIYVGDSAGMNKITTGGGLNYGGNGAIILTDMLYNDELTNYRSKWIEKFKRELQIQGILRELFLTMDEDEIVEAMTILSKTEVFNALLATGDMDYHASDLHKLLFEKDLMKILLGKGRFRRIIRKLFTKI
jgi:flavin-dependent dehydrogenase